MVHGENSAIKAVIDLYGFLVDTQRFDLFDQVYTKNVDADWGGSAVWNDLEPFKRDFATYHAIFDATHHVMTNMVCEVNGDKATAVTYGHWLLVRTGTPGGDEWRGTGWYDDELTRTPDGWRISRRRSGLIRSWGNEGVMSPGGVQFSLKITSLRDAAKANAVRVLPLLERKR